MFTIQKEKRPVEVVYADQSRQAGSFFVSLNSSQRHGPESIGDLLNGTQTYLPFETEDGEITIVRKSAILIAYLNHHEVPDTTRLSTKVLAQVTFFSGYHVSGYIYNDLPSAYPRLSDYLNGTQTFFHLEIDSRDCLVNSEFIKFVTPSPNQGGPD